jgi:hypothetical protein
MTSGCIASSLFALLVKTKNKEPELAKAITAG